MNESATQPISAEAADAGLGVHTIRFSVGGATLIAIGSCNGTYENPCPSHWAGSVAYNPKNLPTGIDAIPVTAEDAIGHLSSAGNNAIVKVDHTAPTLALSGTITEQATLGTHLGEYTLKYQATDGTEAAPQSGVASGEVLLDGAPLAAGSTTPGCSSKNCSIVKEVTLQTGSLSVGTHTLQVTVADAVGLKTTKSLSFTIARDTTPPTVKLSGAFFEGPKGWLEQQSYGDNIVATDAAAGVRTIKLLWDGNQIQSGSFNNCHESATCEAKLASTVNTSAYGGGAHTAEVVVTDWAGNTSRQAQTVNINPKGAVAASQITNTVEAVEATAPETFAVAPTSEIVPVEEMSEGNNPGLKETAAGKFAATGVPTATTVATGASSSITIPTPEAAPLKVTPVSTSGSGSVQLAEQVAAVAPSTKAGVDTILRPKYDGLLDFQVIRETSSPESFSWEVALQSEETMRMLEGSTSAGVFYGGVEVMLIECMPAHDALGQEVPTHLEVSGGNIVTLKVEHHKAAFTYPVVAGPSFEVGYSSVVAVIPPPPPKEPPSGGEEGNPSEIEEEANEAGEGQSLEVQVGAPEPGEPNPEGGATASKLPSHYVPAEYVMCSAGELFGIGGCEFWERHMNLKWHYNGAVAWWNPKQVHPDCHEAESGPQVTQSVEYCNWTGNNFQPYGNGYHISAQLELAVTVTVPIVGYSKQSFPSGIAYLYGDGYASDHLHITGNVCNPSC